MISFFLKDADVTKLEFLKSFEFLYEINCDFALF